MRTSDAAASQHRSGTQTVSVHVRFSPSQGRRLQRSEPTTCGDGQALWAERPTVMERADGTYDLIGTTTHPDGLARWVLSFGNDATVKGPDRFRQRVASEARRVWEQYTS
jgi:predicted DNA-binding transcriptional regulator YafY